MAQNQHFNAEWTKIYPFKTDREHLAGDYTILDFLKVALVKSPPEMTVQATSYTLLNKTLILYGVSSVDMEKLMYFGIYQSNIPQIPGKWRMVEATYFGVKFECISDEVLNDAKVVPADIEMRFWSPGWSLVYEDADSFVLKPNNDRTFHFYFRHNLSSFIQEATSSKYGIPSTYKYRSSGNVYSRRMICQSFIFKAYDSGLTIEENFNQYAVVLPSSNFSVANHIGLVYKPPIAVYNENFCCIAPSTYMSVFGVEDEVAYILGVGGQNNTTINANSFYQDSIVYYQEGDVHFFRMGVGIRLPNRMPIGAKIFPHVFRSLDGVAIKSSSFIYEVPLKFNSTSDNRYLNIQNDNILVGEFQTNILYGVII